MTFKGNEETIRYHLLDFLQSVAYYKEHEPDKSNNDIADGYIKNQISMEDGLEEFYQYIKEVERKNKRILRAVKTVMGKTFYKHLLVYLDNAQPVDHAIWEIVKEPVGKLQKVTEYGRAIRQEWVQQWSVGTEGDSWEGIICVPLKPGRWLKFNFSM